MPKQNLSLAVNFPKMIFILLNFKFVWVIILVLIGKNGWLK